MAFEISVDGCFHYKREYDWSLENNSFSKNDFGLSYVGNSGLNMVLLCLFIRVYGHQDFHGLLQYRN